jgi:hypothetical protein
MIRRHRRLHVQPPVVHSPEDPMSQIPDTRAAPAGALVPNRGQPYIAQRQPSTGKRSLMSPTMSEPTFTSASVTSATLSPNRLNYVSSPPSTGPREEQDFEERFDARFQTRLMEFLHQHMDPPQVNPGSEVGDPDLPAYPGRRP